MSKVIEYTDNTFTRITDEQYDKIKQVLTSPNAPQFMEINGEIVKIYSIYGVVDEETAQKHIEYCELEANKKAGNWKCEYGKWHSKQFRDCSCFAPKYRRDTHKVEVVIQDLTKPMLTKGD